MKGGCPADTCPCSFQQPLTHLHGTSKAPKALEFSGPHAHLPLVPFSPVSFPPAQPPLSCLPSVHTGLLLTPLPTCHSLVPSNPNPSCWLQDGVKLPTHLTYAPSLFSPHVTLASTGTSIHTTLLFITGLPEPGMLLQNPPLLCPPPLQMVHYQSHPTCIPLPGTTSHTHQT